MQEPIVGGDVGMDSVIMIIPQKEPTSGKVGMSLDKTTMSLQGINDS